MEMKTMEVKLSISSSRRISFASDFGIKEVDDENDEDNIEENDEFEVDGDEFVYVINKVIFNSVNWRTTKFNQSSFFSRLIVLEYQSHQKLFEKLLEKNLVSSPKNIILMLCNNVHSFEGSFLVAKMEKSCKG